MIHGMISLPQNLFVWAKAKAFSAQKPIWENCRLGLPVYRSTSHSSPQCSVFINAMAMATTNCDPVHSIRDTHKSYSGWVFQKWSFFSPFSILSFLCDSYNFHDLRISMFMMMIDVGMIVTQINLLNLRSNVRLSQQVSVLWLTADIYFPSTVIIPITWSQTYNGGHFRCFKCNIR